jgi:hypothetical protein
MCQVRTVTATISISMTITALPDNPHTMSNSNSNRNWNKRDSIAAPGRLARVLTTRACPCFLSRHPRALPDALSVVTEPPVVIEPPTPASIRKEFKVPPSSRPPSHLAPPFAQLLLLPRPPPRSLAFPTTPVAKR